MDKKPIGLSFSLDYKNGIETWVYHYEANDIREDLSDYKVYPYGKLLLDFFDFDFEKITNTGYTILEFLGNVNEENYKAQWNEFADYLKGVYNIVNVQIFQDICNKLEYLLTCKFDDYKDFYDRIYNLAENFRLLDFNHEILRKFVKQDVFSEKLKNDNNENRIEKILKKEQSVGSTFLFARNVTTTYSFIEINGHICLKVVNSTGYDFSSVLAAYFFDFIQNEIYLRKCKNCGNPFIANGKSIYCDRKFDEKGHTCKQVGAQAKYQRELVNDIASEEYYKVYKRLYARVKNDKMKRDDFNKWKKEAKHKLLLISNKKLDTAEFLEWLNDY